jgi:hypothetical protein
MATASTVEQKVSIAVLHRVGGHRHKTGAIGLIILRRVIALLIPVRWSSPGPSLQRRVGALIDARKSRVVK